MIDCTRNRHPQPTSQAQLDLPGYLFDYYWFAFYQGWQKDRNLKGHHLRDGVAFRELSVPLDERGGRYNRLIPNGPASPEMLENAAATIRKFVDANQRPLVEDVVEYRPVDVSFLGPNKLLVVSTRVPMNDFQQEDRVRVQPGFTSLEQSIIRVCRPYLPVCARSRVRLSDLLAAQLDSDYADRADIRFLIYKEWYAELRAANAAAKSRTGRDRRRSAVYLLQLPEVPELHGADLLVMWGQGGTQTLAFAQLLRAELSHLLDWYGFSMVELAEPSSASEPEPNEPFEFVHSLCSWERRVLLQGVLLDRSGQRVLPRRPVLRGRPPLAPEGSRPIRVERPREPAPGLRHGSGD